MGDQRGAQEALAREKTLLESLAELSLSLQASSSPEQALKIFSEKAAKPAGASLALLAIAKNDALFAKEISSGKELSFQRGGMLWKALDSGKELLDNRLGKYGEFNDARELFEKGARSIFAAPLKKLNALIILASPEAQAFSEEKVAFAKSASQLLDLSLTRLELEERASEASELLNAVLESSPDPVVVSDGKSIVAANSLAKKLLPSGENSEGRKISEVFQDKRASAAVAESLLQGIQVTFVTDCAARTGSATLQVECAPFFGERALVALRLAEVSSGIEEEAGAKEVLDNAPDAIFSFDDRGRVSSAFGAVKRQLGFEPKELAGQPFSSIIFPADFNTWSEAVQDARMGNSPAREIRLVSKSGAPRAYEAKISSRKSSKNESIFYASLRDLEEKRQSRATESLLSSFIANSSDAVYSFDSQGVVRSWNKSAEKSFGYPAKDAVGRDVRFIFPQEKNSELDELMRRLANGETVSAFETQRVRKNGEKMFVLTTLFPLKDPRGKITEHVALSRDISDLKKLAEIEKAKRALEQQNRQLIERSEMQSMFVSNVSHELRTPLTSILGYSQLLLEGVLGGLGPEQRNSISIINTETQRLTRLINDVLDFSKLDSGKMKLSFKEFDLRDLKEKCSLSSLAEKKGLSVSWEVSDDVPPITGDQNRIAQVLINLVSNAIKFTSKGGVTVHIFRKSKRKIQIEVIDTGAGIPPDEKKNIFKRFYQVQKKAAGKAEGTGLGLNIAKEIIKLHGGKLELESEVGKGSKFFFTLPVMPRKKEAKDAAKEEKPVGQQSLSFISDSEPEQSAQ